jgi:hypothetical protein
MDHTMSSHRDGSTVLSRTADVVLRHSSSIALLDRTLRRRRAFTGFGALLREEVIAYELVWPN